jgi:toxin ParE1/3/4
MSAFKLTPDTKASLSSIATYTEKTWGKKQRNAYIKHLDDSFHTLAINPNLGKERPEIHPKLQSYGVAKHVVFYIKKPQFIVIVNILHQHMDYIQHISTTDM